MKFWNKPPDKDSMTLELRKAIARGQIADSTAVWARLNNLTQRETAMILREIANEFDAA